MKVGGYSLRDHLRLLAPLFGFIAMVWVLRLVLDAAGITHSFVRAFSVTGAAAVAVLLAALLIYFRRFGSYPNVVIACLLLVAWGQVLIVLAIVFAVATGTENVFTAPEFSIPGDDTYHVRHILGHLTMGVGAGTLFGAATGCLVLWLLRLIVPMQPRKSV